jgi:dTDP-4-dehydrorhamnose reductase
MREGAPLRFVDDQRGHPTIAADLARELVAIAHERRAGISHVTNQGAVSWYEFARAVVDAAGGDPTRVRRVRGRFGAMVHMPSAITVRRLGADRFDVLTETGEPAVEHGHIELA